MVYRVGRPPQPWAWLDWGVALADRTFGNRWDDPLGQYRVLYGSTSRYGAWLEKLARFRPAPVAPVLSRDEPLDVTSGDLPRSELARWRMGLAQLRGEYADIGHSESLAVLRPFIWPGLASFGLAELDAGAIRAAAPRRLTQELSRVVYEWRDPVFAGIRYGSRLGDDVENWALFERDDLGLDLLGIDEGNPAEDHELERALQTLRIRLV